MGRLRAATRTAVAIVALLGRFYRSVIIAVIAMRLMRMTIVQIVEVVTVFDCGMPATLAMLVIVMGGNDG